MPADRFGVHLQEVSVLKQARVAPITRTHLHTTRTFLRDASLNLDPNPY